MRTLYFDLDGTILIGDTGMAKPALADGKLELAVQQAGINRLICVGSIVDIVAVAEEVDATYCKMDALFKLCGGVFADKAWFSENVLLARSSEMRAREVNLKDDWWYVDDMAQYYFRVADREDIFLSNYGGRIMVPSPCGDGQDVVTWMKAMK